MPKNLPDRTAPLCECPFLKEVSTIQGSQIFYDEQLNEYRLSSWLPNGERIERVIYHCFFCGGRASESKRRKTIDPSDFLYGSKGEAVSPKN